MEAASALMDIRMLLALAKEHKRICMGEPCVVSMYRIKMIAEKIAAPHLDKFTSDEKNLYHHYMMSWPI